MLPNILKFGDLYDIIYPIGSVITCQKDTFNYLGTWDLLDEETIKTKDGNDIILQRWLRKE